MIVGFFAIGQGYTAAIGACERNGLWEEALQLLRSMVNVQPDVMCLNAAMRVCTTGKPGFAHVFLVI